MSAATSARVLLVDDTGTHDVFEVVDVTDALVRARTPFLFEVGEEVRVRIERGDAVTDATARVRAHVGPADARVTELELSDASAPRRAEAGAG